MAPNTLQSALGEREDCQRGPPVPPFSLLPSALLPLAAAAAAAVSGWRASRRWIRARSLSEMLGAAEAALYALPPDTQGTYQSNWGGLTDDHLLTM